MELLNSTLDYLNANQPVVIGLAALAAIAVQYGINRFRDLSKLTNYALALLALPGVMTALAAYGTSLHLSAYPWTVVAGQFLYALYEKLKANAVRNAVVDVPVTTEATVLGPGV